MQVRRTAVVAVALLCALAAPSRASGTVQLDGLRRTHATYKATLTETAVGTERINVSPDPAIDDCGKDSCDITAVVLRLPHGTSSGRFKATLTMPREFNGAIALFDREGQRVSQADIASSCCGDSVIRCCDQVPSVEWKVSFVVPRLAAGSYTVVVWDRGGVGEVKTDLDFRANPPDRPAHKG